VNVIFALISLLSEEKYKNKKGQTNIEIDLSGSVERSPTLPNHWQQDLEAVGKFV
jgi:hypothetical protein